MLRSSVGDDNQRTGAAGDRTSRPTFACVTVTASHAREERREGVITSDQPVDRSPQAAETIGRQPEPEPDPEPEPEPEP